MKTKNVAMQSKNINECNKNPISRFVASVESNTNFLFQNVIHFNALNVGYRKNTSKELRKKCIHWRLNTKKSIFENCTMYTGCEWIKTKVLWEFFHFKLGVPAYTTILYEIKHSFHVSTSEFHSNSPEIYNPLFHVMQAKCCAVI